GFPVPRSRPEVPEPPPAGANYLGLDKETWRQIANERYINPDMDLPFSDRLRCCGGDFWLTRNARAPRPLIHAPRGDPELFNYYSTAFCPDESLCHTILGNDPDLRISKDNRRFTVWPDVALTPAHWGSATCRRSSPPAAISPAKSLR